MGLGKQNERTYLHTVADLLFLTDLQLSYQCYLFKDFYILFRRTTEPFKPCYYLIPIVIPFSIAFRIDNKLFNIILKLSIS